jgi:peptidoglycan/LPS O-acetylase OafA/YrhL
MNDLTGRFQNNYDFLRLFAAFCIAFTHSFNLLHLNDLEPLMSFSGNRYDFSFIGLSIFFCVSGYLIIKSACTSISFLHYCWKRFLRIQPLLILVCILTVLIVGPLYTSLDTSTYFANPATWTYFRNIFPATGIQFTLPGVFEKNIAEKSVNGSLWTLIVEERLYLFVGLLFLVRHKKKYFVYLVLFINLVYLCRSIFFPDKITTYLNGSHVFYAMLFLNSGVFYLLNLDFSNSKMQKFWLLFIPVAIMCMVWPVLNFLQVLVIPFCVIALAHIKGVTNRAGKWGDFTYGIYIFSFPVQQILIASNLYVDNPYLLFLETILIVVPLAILSWYVIEKKFLSLKNIIY